MEVKFRTWDKDKKWMVYDVQDAYDGLWSEKNSDEVNDYYSYVSTFQSFTDEEEFNFMQYTGLKDKNGVEIYEGDYIDCKWGSDDWSGVVEFIEGSFCTNPLSDSKFPSIINECSSIKVIGNIYENPELLKEQNK